jgi:hypothetical protein
MLRSPTCSRSWVMSSPSPSSPTNQLGFIPFYYQAGTELGYPDIAELSVDIKDLLRYPGLDTPRPFVPDEIPMEFDALAMEDIDR